MNNQKDLFIFAGEASGDLLGSELIKQLLKTKNDLKIEAVAGPLMRSFPITSFLSTELFHVMGFIDVLKALPALMSYFKQIKEYLLKNPPKILVLIDYPGFNLRLAKALKKEGFSSPIIQYVCPTVWAWKKGRIKTMTETLDSVFCLFPFEKEFFKNTSLKAFYVGHPLINKIPLPLSSGFSKKESLILLFPGSRYKEIERNLLLQLQSALIASKKNQDYKIGISYSNQTIKELIQRKISLINQENIFLFPSTENYTFMKKATLALATSGTITLELALHHLPTIVTYKMSLFDTFLAKWIFHIKLPFYCIVNYLMKELVFPEFYGPNITIKKISLSVQSLLEHKEKLDNCHDKTFLIRDLLKPQKKNLEPSDLLINRLISK